MDSIYLKARAKINLTIDVLNRRSDGYHNIEMIMQTISLHDNVSIHKIKGQEQTISLTSNLSYLPVNEKNLAYRAAKLLMDEYEIRTGVHIELQKNIPVAAGLAGGSSDAAAVLFGVNRLFNLKIPFDNLCRLGAELGADIPFCIMRGTALAQGIGDDLTRLPPCPDFFTLIAKPSVAVSTQHIYQALDLTKIEKRPNTQKMISAIKSKDVNYIAENLVNVLETVTAKQYPVIGLIKEAMLLEGAIGALMSGSGPSVFGIFEKRKDAVNCANIIKTKFKLRDVYVSHIF